MRTRLTLALFAFAPLAACGARSELRGSDATGDATVDDGTRPGLSLRAGIFAGHVVVDPGDAGDLGVPNVWIGGNDFNATVGITNDTPDAWTMAHSDWAGDDPAHPCVVPLVVQDTLIAIAPARCQPAADNLAREVDVLGGRITLQGDHLTFVEQTDVIAVLDGVHDVHIPTTVTFDGVRQ